MTPYDGTIEYKPIIAVGNKLHCGLLPIDDPAFSYNFKLATLHGHLSLGKYHAKLIAERYNAYGTLVDALHEITRTTNGNDCVLIARDALRKVGL